MPRTSALSRALLVLLPCLALSCGDGGDDPVDEGCAEIGCGAGQVCVSDACVATCTTNDDCAGATSECWLEGEQSLCVAPRWSSGPGQHGTSCALAGATDCADGYRCLRAGPDDPFAYCSTTCETDRDCPPTHECAPDDGENVCVTRSMCSACSVDAQCTTPRVPDGVCSPDPMTTMGVCTKACAGGETCPAGFECKAGVCEHKSGSCDGDGSTCAPCIRTTDCDVMASCVQFAYSGERFCAAACSAGNPCEAPYVCTQGRCGPPEEYEGTCTP